MTEVEKAAQEHKERLDAIETQVAKAATPEAIETAKTELNGLITAYKAITKKIL